MLEGWQPSEDRRSVTESQENAHTGQSGGAGGIPTTPLDK